jgi:hypothetical protein
MADTKNFSVVPAKAGIHLSAALASDKWVPTFAGDDNLLLCALCLSGEIDFGAVVGRGRGAYHRRSAERI